MTETRTLHPSPASEASRLPPGRARSLAVRAVALWPAVTTFVASRLVVLAVLYVSPVLHPGYKRRSFFSDWDAAHYLYIAAHGYPQLHSPGGGFNARDGDADAGGRAHPDDDAMNGSRAGR
ncbi:MAG: hypothetical protein ACRDWW_01195 [Acidimicrobiales bacterium]